MVLRLPPAWAIVLAGLILNIMAIVMSSLVLDKLEAEKRNTTIANTAMYIRYN